MPPNATKTQLEKGQAVAEKWANLLEGYLSKEKDISIDTTEISKLPYFKFQKKNGAFNLIRSLQLIFSKEKGNSFVGIIQLIPKDFILEGVPLILIDAKLDGVLDSGSIPLSFIKAGDQTRLSLRGNYLTFENAKLSKEEKELLDSWYKYLLNY